MCVMNHQPVNSCCSPCAACPEYLASCKPLIIDGFIYGECDMCYCEFCDEDCEERG